VGDEKVYKPRAHGNRLTNAVNQPAHKRTAPSILNNLRDKVKMSSAADAYRDADPHNKQANFLY
jgi:hypothetical protein